MKGVSVSVVFSVGKNGDVDMDVSVFTYSLTYVYLCIHLLAFIYIPSLYTFT